MNMHGIPAKSGHAVALPGHLSEQLLLEHADLARALHKAVRPYGFQLSATSTGVEVSGDDVAVLLVTGILERLGAAFADNEATTASQAEEIIDAVITRNLRGDLSFRLEGLIFPLVPMSLSQVAFMRAMLERGEGLVIGVGPTGTGKTHLAIAAALNQLAEERVKHIVITRPHVLTEGEVVTAATRRELEYDDQFEFFEDILRDLIGYQVYERLVKERKLEIAPLGHLRGRTFNHSFIIVDEAQYLSVPKMRMVVTRIGRDSRMVVMGDPDSADPRGEGPSGLSHLLDLVDGTDIARVHRFEKTQIIRSGIVARLEELYARQEQAEPRFMPRDI